MITNNKQMKQEVKAIKKLLTVKAGDKVWDPREYITKATAYHDEQQVPAWDDVSGAILDPKDVRSARLTEMTYAREKKVWVKIPRARAIKNGWKIIKTKWIDINKGDDRQPVYRSRFVGKEFNNSDVEGLFAGTPPLKINDYYLAKLQLRRRRHHTRTTSL